MRKNIRPLVKIILIIYFSAIAIFFGSYFLKDYHKIFCALSVGTYKYTGGVHATSSEFSSFHKKACFKPIIERYMNGEL
jgi:hypothetical protein